MKIIFLSDLEMCLLIKRIVQSSLNTVPKAIDIREIRGCASSLESGFDYVILENGQAKTQQWADHRGSADGLSYRHGIYVQCSNFTSGALCRRTHSGALERLCWIDRLCLLRNYGITVSTVVDTYSSLGV